ncbi:hypothetical protein Poli38472_012751 [Pythium oligandrum]|uniref:Uncharacterized protein n=1 Tax=Pythium oligandrum TaxID=41045 RepID=A0A8K1FFE4_PYTOL|nr:hypothetical protein Poli38472_012751 [Pythium oligandrum]|eukprot:TMW61560.1 hypothetical protein Poli38472_012751 [Pythium oligandrum]
MTDKRKQRVQLDPSSSRRTGLGHAWSEHNTRHEQWQDITRMVDSDVESGAAKAPLPAPRRARVTQIVVILFALCVVGVAFIATEFEFLPTLSEKIRRPLVGFWEDKTSPIHQYECVGWRPTKGCTPDGEVSAKLSCNTVIKGRSSGYCELRHRRTGVTRKVLKMHCDSVKPDVKLKCADYQTLLGYGHLVSSYIHDSDFSFKTNQQKFLLENNVTTAIEPAAIARGIVFVVYDRLLPGAYASIRNLRAKGCTLPIELWSRPGEIRDDHPILRELVANHGAYRRIIHDKHATGYFTKLHAVFYSAFDSVLLLDADNFPVRDPEYLFETAEFRDTGALFWPDYRRPARRGDWDIIDNSILWEVLDMPYVDMFEQESGQVMINRHRHERALNALMFFGFHHPRVMDDLKLVWGDKDLFRLAWLKTNSTFYWSARPAGSAGPYDPKSQRFCGGTIVQHDPAGEVIFLHRNTWKLQRGSTSKRWTHIEQFKVGVDLSKYSVTSVDAAPDFPNLGRCYGEHKDFTNYELTPIAELPFANIEDELIAYFEEGLKLE